MNLCKIVALYSLFGGLSLIICHEAPLRSPGHYHAEMERPFAETAKANPEFGTAIKTFRHCTSPNKYVSERVVNACLELTNQDGVPFYCAEESEAIRRTIINHKIDTRSFFGR